MFKNRSCDGTCNLCGAKIAQLRKQLPQKTSQRQLAEKVQEIGVDLDKNAIQRIESGERFVTDIELKAFSEIFNVTMDSFCSKEQDSAPILPDLLE
ncbi:MAG TPA: helix-turn-helix transcriptional regulator [Candidatus Fimivicinus intestinavium]|nr:helix-turn-helix transcriptional regulator [Candidatus Fimivicinus intestinavium]